MVLVALPTLAAVIAASVARAGSALVIGGRAFDEPRLEVDDGTLISYGSHPSSATLPRAALRRTFLRRSDEPSLVEAQSDVCATRVHFSPAPHARSSAPRSSGLDGVD